MRILSPLLVLVAALNLLGEDPESAYRRRNSWTETLLANQGNAIPPDFRRDDPLQALSFHNICGWKCKSWPTAAMLEEFEHILRSKIFMSDSRHLENELRELDAISTLKPDQKIPAILDLFEKTLFREEARLRKRLPPIAFVRRARHGLRGTNATMFSQRTERGLAICIVDPGTGQVRSIFETAEGFILDIKPSYDISKLVMSYELDNGAPFHIWEINIDGTGLRRITDGPYHPTFRGSEAGSFEFSRRGWHGGRA